MSMVFPDYTHSILNLASSILKAFGCECHHPSLPVLDQALAEPRKNRIFLILDAMGDEFVKRQFGSGWIFPQPSGGYADFGLPLHDDSRDDIDAVRLGPGRAWLARLESLVSRIRPDH